MLTADQRSSVLKILQQLNICIDQSQLNYNPNLVDMSSYSPGQSNDAETGKPQSGVADDQGATKPLQGRTSLPQEQLNFNRILNDN